MIADKIPNYISKEDYLSQEEDSAIKHEYSDGEIYAMAGASDAHVTIAGNLFALLINHVRGTGCRVYMADMKAYIEAANSYYYPDVMVTCDARDRELTNYKKYPCLIVEVLSPKTEAFDRGNKFYNYQKLYTLVEYVLISQDHQRLDCFRRNAQGIWTLQFYDPGTEINLESVDFRTSIEALYEDVT
ncbi:MULTISPECIES: Uma2 family endonuclease [unclassified Moorena]|uniref:Uma2 family endonuclease n=1 Tax=unclassified Moorena TaxID=2683338 RepID=UPI0013C5A86D|nr:MULTISPECIES: Uma2 family endonuclease [unclassified Moorena]NEO20606.1 Uma2 family endonuclease [Moorena sp. SIO4A5]NEQ58579.1 Uma2 family endonuclease [Moorena sp. SIO4A1]